jgi:small subunit ribosomal protein S6e
MKFNIACPSMGTMKCIEVLDEKRLHEFYDKRMSNEIDGSVLGDEWAGYVFRIAGGNDMQGFPMMQGVLVNGRVRLLMKKGFTNFKEKCKGERRRRSVRGCIVGSDIAVLNLTVVKIGDNPIPGFTDEESAQPKRLGPKRANHIRRLYNLTTEDDVRQYVSARTFKTKAGREVTKRPRIQRLLTPRRVGRTLKMKAAKKAALERSRAEAAAYKAMIAARNAQKREELAARRSSRRSSRRA